MPPTQCILSGGIRSATKLSRRPSVTSTRRRSLGETPGNPGGPRGPKGTQGIQGTQGGMGPWDPLGLFRSHSAWKAISNVGIFRNKRRERPWVRNRARNESKTNHLEHPCSLGQERVQNFLKTYLLEHPSGLGPETVPKRRLAYLNNTLRALGASLSNTLRGVGAFQHSLSNTLRWSGACQVSLSSTLRVFGVSQPSLSDTLRRLGARWWRPLGQNGWAGL